MQIKRINISQYHLVTALFNNYRVFYKQPANIALAESFIIDRLKNNESVIFVALVNNSNQERPAGFTQLYPLISSVRAAKNWLLNDLYVDAAYRKQGIGEGLVKAAMDFSLAENAKFIKLETAVDNYSAQRLYEAAGFKKEEPGTSFFTYQAQLDK